MDKWDRLGNEFLSGESSQIYSILVKGSLLFAATTKGLYRLDTNTIVRGWVPVWVDSGAFSLLSANGRIYVGVKGEVRWSADDGITWSTLPINGGGEVRSLLNQNGIYAGVSNSKKNGVHYLEENSTSRYLGTDFPIDAPVNSIVSNGEQISVGTLSGFYSSKIPRVSWMQQNSGLFSATCFSGGTLDLEKKTHMQIFSLVQHESKIYASTSWGVFVLDTEKSVETIRRQPTERRGTQNRTILR